MARYIDAEALIHFIEERERHCIPTKNGTDKPISTNTMKMVINQADTVDVAEVKHGRWIETSTHNGCTPDYDCVCSECGTSGLPYNNYCSNCGARMDGDK